MRRREFMAFLGGAAVWPVAARAQQADGVRRIGVVTTAAQGDPRWIAFRQSLEKLGWTEGRNVQIDYHRPVGGVVTKALAEELVNSKPDVAMATSTPSLRLIQQATRTIPIVFVSVSDPVGDGFIASLARPGGNITGFSNYEPSLAGKWLDLLKEIAPHLSRVLILFNPDTAPHSLFLGPLELAARSSTIEPIAVRVRGTAEIDGAVAAHGGGPGAGLVAMPDSFLTAHRDVVAASAARHRLPAVYPFRFFAESGGLVSYGADQLEQWSRAPSYIDRILRGEKPANLPVQAPTKFELVINRKTADALGIEIPPSLLARADEVIE